MLVTCDVCIYKMKSLTQETLLLCIYCMSQTEYPLTKQLKKKKNNPSAVQEVPAFGLSAWNTTRD